MNRIIKALCLLMAALSLCICCIGCQGNTANTPGSFDHESSYTGKGTNIKMTYVAREIDSMKIEDFEASSTQTDYVLMTVKNYGSVVIALRADVAPKTVANFKKLVGAKFYDGTAFHRVIEHFMIQGGGSVIVPNEESTGNEESTTSKGSTFVAKEAPSIKGEFDKNGFTNNLLHIRGVISMARTDKYDSASCQFFIIHETNASSENLNGGYASFGYVLAGMDVVDAIATCQVFGDEDAPIPLEDVVIESIKFVKPKQK